jgi:cyclic pyranopterin phosphate synthase
VYAEEQEGARVNVRSLVREALAPVYRRSPALKAALMQADVVADRVRHAAARVVPRIVQPDPRALYISLTAACNNACKGCHYGRDFMRGHALPLRIVKDLLDDARAAGFERVRLYGGEPLLRHDLPEIVAHAAGLRLGMWVSTNGVLLEQKIDALVAAGLRDVSVGLYGVDEAYDDYVQRPKRFERVERGIAYARARYGKGLTMHLDWLLMRPTCNDATVRATCRLAQRYQMPIVVNLIHYSLPYFVGPEQSALHFRAEDRPRLEAIVAELLRFKQARPDLVLNSAIGLRAIPDWLLKGPAMRVPCAANRLIWVGPDGTVQMCYVTFKLGNLYEQRLSEMLFTTEHRKAARDAFALNCPNCHCGYDNRTLRHGPSRRLYARPPRNGDGGLQRGEGALPRQDRAMSSR